MSTDARAASTSPLTTPGILADEAVLKRIFDAEFEASLAHAKAQLGDAPMLAPRVVETAFVNVWSRRATIPTQDQLKTALADELRHGAARALSRRSAAGRMAAGGKHGGGAHGAPSAAKDDVWANVLKTITAPAASRAAHERVSRHDAASHLRGVGKQKSWVMPVIVLLGAITASVAGVMYVSRLGVDDAVITAVSGQNLQPVVTSSPGQIGTFSLGDGTKLKIGPETKVFVPDGFPTKIRAVRIEGTASFDVAPTTETMPLPFRVVAKRNHVITTGTVFAVSAYPGDSAILVSVKQGSVKLKSGKAESAVAAGQTYVADAGTTRVASSDEAAGAFNWIDGRITVPKTQLRYVVGALTRWFNFDVKVVDLPLLDRDAWLDVPLDSSRLAISQVEKSANVKFAYEGETKIFRDATPAAKPAGKKR